MDLVERIGALVAEPQLLNAEDAAAAAMSFEDTLAVTVAGWAEPSALVARSVYGIASGPLEPATGADAEKWAMAMGIAGHALDYDDVHLVSVTHPSVVLVPALLAMADRRPELVARVLPAYSVGLGVNVALGKALGFEHYHLGWHATSTIGPLAGAAALAHLLGLDARGARHALALAAAQSGGMQRNFGTMAKHFQAGHAAAAAVRAAILAEAGMTGDENILGPRGFLDLYSRTETSRQTDEIVLTPDVHSVSRKLYPCCYVTHRMISTALDVRASLEDGIPGDARIVVEVPYGAMRPLHVVRPRDGAEAKFCAAYCVATALAQGSVALADFSTAAVHRPQIRALMAQVETVEQALRGPAPVGIDHGEVRIRVMQGDRCLAHGSVRSYPGAPDAPIQDAKFEAKVADCLSCGTEGAPEAFRAQLWTRIGLDSMPRAKVRGPVAHPETAG
jgi:2-methylcitrate dehydratase PrpD